VLQELSASPTSLQAANMNLMYGLLPNHRTTTADAVKAYVQSLLKSKYPTWVQLPKELWPAHWHGRFRNPVVLLIRSLYGHPESGAHWEQHLREIVQAFGGEELKEHPSSFYFKDTQMLLTIYVDDLILSGPAQNHDKIWSQLKQKVELEDVTELDRFLGRHHRFFTKDGMRCVAYDMRDYAQQACDMYTSLNPDKPLRPAPTPFCPEGSLIPSDDIERGELAPVACRILMKLLWLARLSRPDLLKPIGDLASLVVKWSRNCDKQLHRMLCYLHGSKGTQFVGVVGDEAKDLTLRIFADSDFASDRLTARSTTGGLIAVCGPNTFYPIHWVSKRQTATSRSSTESEIVSMANLVFGEGLPLHAMLETLLQRTCQLELMEDNEATIKIIKKGYSSKLRSMTRTHRVDISALKEVVDRPEVQLYYVRTKFQAADIFTKCLTPQLWPEGLRMLNLYSNPEEVSQESLSLMLKQFLNEQSKCET